MKSHLPVNLRTVVTALCGVGLAMGVFAYRAQADEWNKRTIVTIDQPIQVKERLLQPGTYVFKLLDSQSDRHIVQIYNGDQSHIIDTVLAIPNYRLQPTGDTQFAFWETPAGDAKAIRAWFYPGDNFGQEFPKPKHFIELEASAATTTAPVPVASEPVTQPAEPEAAVTPVPETQPAQPETEPEEVAQATPPPTTATPAPAPEQPSAERSVPESLPKTSSPYPLIGLSGLFSLGLYGLLRLKRSA